MQLYVVRHGIAVAHVEPGGSDDARPLTPGGEQRMKEIGRALGSIGVRPERIVSSPLPRALRTAEIVAEALGDEAAVETDDALRTGRSAETVRDWLIARREERLMIVGHNPTLSDLVALLVAGRSDLPLCDLRKGGVAALEGTPRTSMAIDWLARPKLLRAIED